MQKWKRVRPFTKRTRFRKGKGRGSRGFTNLQRRNCARPRSTWITAKVVSACFRLFQQGKLHPRQPGQQQFLLTYVNQTDPHVIDFFHCRAGTHAAHAARGRGQAGDAKGNIYVARLKAAGRLHVSWRGQGYIHRQQGTADNGRNQARAVFRNSDGSIMPGQYVRIFTEGDILKDAILIPQNAFPTTQKGSSVMALNAEDVVSEVPIEIIATVGDRYLVGNGLKAGDRIISEGLVKPGPAPRCA